MTFYRKGIGARLSSPLSPSNHARRASAGGPLGALTSSPTPPKPRPTGGGAGGAAELGPLPGFHTKHQRYISKDREVLKVLEVAVGKGNEAGMSFVLIFFVFIFEFLSGDANFFLTD